MDADGDVLYYDIEPSQYSSAFKIDRWGHITATKEGTAILDRETMTGELIILGVRVKDSKHHVFTTVKVKVRDMNDVWPKMREKSYEAKVYAPLHFMQDLVKVGVDGGDQDTDDMRFRIQSGNELGLFDIDSKNGVIRASRAHEDAGEHRLTVEVSDKGDYESGEENHIDRTEVLVKILPGNFRKPEFKFPNQVNSTLPAIEVRGFGTIAENLSHFV